MGAYQFQSTSEYWLREENPSTTKSFNMRWSVASVIRLALHASSALALVTPRAPARAFRCGSENPPAELLAQAEEFAARVAPQETTALAAISVNTYFHVVTSAAKQGQYSQTQLSNQVEYPRTVTLSHSVFMMRYSPFLFSFGFFFAILQTCLKLTSSPALVPQQRICCSRYFLHAH